MKPDPISKPPDLIIFDLDGTLSDPGAGVNASVNYALAHHGFAELPAADIAKHIGPSIDQIFSWLTGCADESKIRSLVAKYRERYSAVGYAENTLYEGIGLVLEKFNGLGVKMGVCTSKRADFAERILTMFKIRHHFEFVSGGDIGIHKWQQLAELKKAGAISTQSIMVGDRAVDLAAAHRNQLTSAGVLWGYGSAEEIAAENPHYVFRVPAELLKLAM